MFGEVMESKVRMEAKEKFLQRWQNLVFIVFGAIFLSACSVSKTTNTLIQIEKQGSFAIGGTIFGDPAVSSQRCDHGVAEYQIPPDARSTNLLMWHSASAAGWQNRWDGGEGFQSIFLRRGFPVYIWDGPRVGRANWGCAETSYAPVLGMDQQNFLAWRLGTTYPNWFDGVQFPTEDSEAWNQATRARYQEFDILENIKLEASAAVALVDKIGPTVALTNSAGGLRALLAASQTENIRGIVAYENVGYIFPEGEGPEGSQGPFGPLKIPLEQFKLLTKIPIMIVWGDNLDKTTRFDTALAHSKLFVELVNRHGGNARILMLPEIGIVGNTHLPFADLNNVEIADLLSDFLKLHGLD